jgi:hypothetical protein
MPSVSWSGVKLTAIGLWSSENVFSGVMNHASPSGCPTDKSGFGGARRRLSARIHSANCKVWWRRNNVLVGQEGVPSPGTVHQCITPTSEKITIHLIADLTPTKDQNKVLKIWLHDDP